MRKVHHQAKLTPGLVQQMRYLYYVKGLKQICLARLYGIHPGTVWDAVNYNTWKHVNDTFDRHDIRFHKA